MAEISKHYILTSFIKLSNEKCPVSDFPHFQAGYEYAMIRVHRLIEQLYFDTFYDEDEK